MLPVILAQVVYIAFSENAFLSQEEQENRREIEQKNREEMSYSEIFRRLALLTGGHQPNYQTQEK